MIPVTGKGFICLCWIIQGEAGLSYHREIQGRHWENSSQPVSMAGFLGELAVWHWHELFLKVPSFLELHHFWVHTYGKPLKQELGWPHVRRKRQNNWARITPRDPKGCRDHKGNSGIIPQSHTGRCWGLEIKPASLGN